MWTYRRRVRQGLGDHRSRRRDRADTSLALVRRRSEPVRSGPEHERLQRLGIGGDAPVHEPRGEVAAVPAEELRALRVDDDVDDLRQIDEDDPSVVNKDVERREVTVGVPGGTEGAQRVDALIPERVELGGVDVDLGEARRRCRSAP